MPVADIYTANALGVQPKSIQDFDGENLLMQAKRQGIQQNALALQEGQQKLQQTQNLMAQRNALTGAIQSGQIDLTNPAHQQAALAMAPDVAPGLLDTIQKTATAKALAEKDSGAGASSQQEARTKAFDLHRQMLPLVGGTQQGVQGWIQGLYADPATRDAAMQLSPDPQAAISRVPAGGPELTQFVQQNAAGMDKFMQDQTQRRGQDVTAADSAANNRTTLAATAMNNATSRANTAAGIAKDYKVAGLDAQGNFTGGGDGGQFGGLIDAIGQGKVPEATALGRVPPGVKSQVLQSVMAKYPDYDPTTIATRQAAAKAFTTGQQGNALRSVATASDHLDQLGQLGDALNNGNLQIVNKIGNVFGVQTGQPAPAVFDAVKNIVGQEVVKAIVAGGGSAGERDEAAKAFSSASSPAQLKQTIGAYRSVMGAQAQNLMEQRRAAGLPDSTLPNYKAASGAAHPPDITDLLNKYGGK